MVEIGAISMVATDHGDFGKPELDVIQMRLNSIVVKDWSDGDGDDSLS